MGKIQEGGGNSFEIVNVGKLKEFLTYTDAIDAPGFFIKVAKEYMPNEDIGSTQTGDNIKTNFEMAFARQDQKTQELILGALQSRIQEDTDDSRAH